MFFVVLKFVSSFSSSGYKLLATFERHSRRSAVNHRSDYSFVSQAEGIAIASGDPLSEGTHGTHGKSYSITILGLNKSRFVTDNNISNKRVSSLSQVSRRCWTPLALPSAQVYTLGFAPWPALRWMRCLSIYLFDSFYSCASTSISTPL